MSIQLLPQHLQDASETGADHSIVVVFNNSHNTFDEVIGILMRATGCSLHEAHMETWEVHHLGKSVVHHGSAEECERVASVIRTIGITVEVRAE
ncbi:MAG TPA: ATP-dependent Clp protease adaptor ClpS [Chthonomonadales bacterium]|nr:ATP-dependent Clp protease adaptor ClpS [Chthonomonadales bacterium]